VGAWAAGELLGFDLETTGVDRFGDVPVSYALVSVVRGAVVRSWSGLIDPGREVPTEATAVHGITTEQARKHGMPLRSAVSLVADAVVAAGRRGVPVVGMRLDYDLTMIESLAVRLGHRGLLERGWRGPVLDAAVLDRHFDDDREGRRTLGDLCSHYGIELGHAHDASHDAIASIEVLFALVVRFDELWHADVSRLHEDQARWHREWTQSSEAWRREHGLEPVDRRDYELPVVPMALPPAA
jgi:DNA polymerase III subunit epsilon